ncbi:HAMP domain-containing histidine kinase [Baekduia soli]|uniref:histidine kinase n=1 Tax=Baekduia soli TaxID=496014 RepID=A0A5B8U075_9ACTN|nr:HAMP domain-containing sensor histidine kinase [Baekduia soli]QEC46381.1 HAMP domain-containing histidine kinase [Baekduia soli]
MNPLAHFRGLRARLLAVVIAAVAGTVVVLTVGFNVVIAHRLHHEIAAVLDARAAAAQDTVRLVNRRVVLTSQSQPDSLDSKLWVFGPHAVSETRGDPRLGRAAAEMAASGTRRRNLAQPPTALLAVPVVSHGQRLGTLVVAASLAPYQHTRRIALAVSLALALFVLGAVAALSRWMLNAALRPVAQMTRSAAEWSAWDLDRRFDLGPPTDELSQLAATLDSLLGRLAAAMRHEQRLSAELSHELRTPLAKIAARAQLAAHEPETPEAVRADLEAITHTAGQMGVLLETLMAAARADPGPDSGRSELDEPIGRAVESCSVVAAHRKVTVGVHLASPCLQARVESALVERMLSPLVENAVLFARSSVDVRAARNGPYAEVRVVDDGPGIDAAELQDIFKPAHRGTAARMPGAHSGAGLGLALARRLARSAGGDISAQATGAGGCFTLSLPCP